MESAPALSSSINVARYRMLKLLDLDAHFRTSTDAVLLNKIDFTRQGYADELNKKLYSQMGELNFVASCDCGHLSDNFYEGARCPICKTIAKPQLTAGRNNLPHTAWLSIPPEIKGVLHPVFYTVLGQWLRFGNKKQNYIDIICNPAEPLPPELSHVITGRGFNYFYDNFDMLMEFFMGYIKKPTIDQARKKAEQIRRFIGKYRSIAFIRYMPALSSVLHPITTADNSENSRKYADKGSQYILQAANTLSFLEFYPQKNRRPGVLDTKVFSAYKSWIIYLNDIVARRLSSKQSLLRRHMFGARFHWSYRAVIVPITGPHRDDELHIPWSVGVKLLKIHLMGRLIRKHHMSVGAADALITMAESKYDPLIDQLMMEFINESPWPGLPSFWNRNPSLQRGSIQLFFITKIKKEIEDKTVGMSVLSLARMNAD